MAGNYSGTLTTSSQIASAGGSATRFRAGDVVTVSDGTTTATYTAVNGDTVQTFLDTINNTANLKIDASLNSNGDIEFEFDRSRQYNDRGYYKRRRWRDPEQCDRAHRRHHELYGECDAHQSRGTI